MGTDLLSQFEEMTVFSVEAMSAVVAWDDVCDKLEDSALKQELNISDRELAQADRILRQVMDASHDRRSNIKARLAAFTPPAPQADKLEAAKAAKVPPEDHDEAVCSSCGQEREEPKGSEHKFNSLT